MMTFRNYFEAHAVAGQVLRGKLAAVQRLYETHPRPENLVVHFSDINKVGVYLPSNWTETPLGIYLYPLKFLIERRFSVPYASERAFAHICEFTRPEKILKMERVPYSADPQDILASQKGLEYLRHVPNSQRIIDHFINNGLEINSNYTVLWKVTAELAQYDIKEWNKLFRRLGIEGFLDDGTQTIHLHEPYQAVVFAKDALKQVYTVDNTQKTTPESPLGQPDRSIVDWFAEKLQNLPNDGPKDLLINARMIVNLFSDEGINNRQGMLEELTKFLQTAPTSSQNKVYTAILDKLRQLQKKLHVPGEHIKNSFKQLFSNVQIP